MFLTSCTYSTYTRFPCAHRYCEEVLRVGLMLLTCIKWDDDSGKFIQIYLLTGRTYPNKYLPEKYYYYNRKFLHGTWDEVSRTWLIKSQDLETGQIYLQRRKILISAIQVWCLSRRTSHGLEMGVSELLRT
jgi:hypothetical protein